MKSILIVGDDCLDIDVHGVCERFAQESAGCPVLREVRRESRPGMAGAVAAMCRGFQIHTTQLSGLVQSVKTRFLVNGRQIWRHDRDAEPLTAPETASLADQVSAAVKHADAVLVVDYGKGACAYPVARAAVLGAKLRGIPCLVDPAPGVDWRTYRDATAIKCNRLEWERAYRDQSAGHRGWWERHVENVVVTEGAKGMTHYPRRASAVEYPGQPTNLVDVTGAGDMVLAALGVSLSRGESWSEAIQFANRMAAKKVEHRGAVPTEA